MEFPSTLILQWHLLGTNFLAPGFAATKRMLEKVPWILVESTMTTTELQPCCVDVLDRHSITIQGILSPTIEEEIFLRGSVAKCDKDYKGMLAGNTSQRLEKKPRASGKPLWHNIHHIHLGRARSSP